MKPRSLGLAESVPLVVVVGACTLNLQHLAPFPCANDGQCPEGLACSAARMCLVEGVDGNDGGAQGGTWPVTGPMVGIPAGDFEMGSNSGESDERPVHTVHVDAFSMDETEVTVEEYAKCNAAGACAPVPTDSNCNYGKSEKGNHPINCVTWNDATAYCRWAGKRLPTEEEWEYGARGTDGRTYPWGDELPEGQLCWNGAGNDVGFGKRQGTCPAGRFAPGGFGLKDMAGNVWEWTSSNYSEDYSKNRTSSRRAFRGGSWSHFEPSEVRSAYRGGDEPSNRGTNVGVRCAQPAGGPASPGAR